MSLLLPPPLLTELIRGIDDNERKPDTAITVEELPDIVLQPEFRLGLSKQFEEIYHEC